MVYIYLLTHKKADVPPWSWAALSFKIPPPSGAISALGMDQRGNMVVVTVRVRRVMAGLFVALAKERQIQSFKR
jgi:hypothetical protein